MINFFIVLFVVFLKQLVFLATFGLSVSINADGIILIPITLLIVYLVSHFLHSKAIYEKIKLDKTLYDVYGFISWLLVGGLITFLIFTNSWLWKILPTTGGMFSGLEYILVPIFLGLYLIALGILKVIVFIVKKISKKN